MPYSSDIQQAGGASLAEKNRQPSERAGENRFGTGSRQL